MLGLWAAEKLGKTGPDAEAYAKEVVVADIEEAGDHDVLRKVRKDFDAAGVDQSDHQIRRTMDELMAQAIEQLRKTVEMDKNFVRSHRYLAAAYQEKGMFTEAISELQTASTLAGENPEKAAKRSETLRQALAASGATGYWEKQLEFLLEDSAGGQVSAYGVASLYARLKKNEEVFKWLEKAYTQRDPYLVYLKIDPPFDSLRSDQRIMDLMRRISLIQ